MMRQEDCQNVEVSLVYIVSPRSVLKSYLKTSNKQNQNKIQVSQMAQQVKVLGAKPEDPS